MLCHHMQSHAGVACPNGRITLMSLFFYDILNLKNCNPRFEICHATNLASGLIAIIRKTDKRAPAPVSP